MEGKEQESVPKRQHFEKPDKKKIIKTLVFKMHNETSIITENEKRTLSGDIDNASSIRSSDTFYEIMGSIFHV